MPYDQIVGSNTFTHEDNINLTIGGAITLADVAVRFEATVEEDIDGYLELEVDCFELEGLTQGGAYDYAPIDRKAKGGEDLWKAAEEAIRSQCGEAIHDKHANASGSFGCESWKEAV